MYRLTWYCCAILNGGRFCDLRTIYQGCRALPFALAGLSCSWMWSQRKLKFGTQVPHDKLNCTVILWHQDTKLMYSMWQISWTCGPSLFILDGNVSSQVTVYWECMRSKTYFLVMNSTNCCSSFCHRVLWVKSIHYWVTQVIRKFSLDVLQVNIAQDAVLRSKVIVIVSTYCYLSLSFQAGISTTYTVLAEISDYVYTLFNGMHNSQYHFIVKV